METRRAFFKRPFVEDLMGWGPSDWYFEVRDDGSVTRQIEAYANGRVLSYDEVKVEDEHGALAEQPLDLDEFSAFRISEEEFAEAWRRARPDADSEMLPGWLFRVEEVSVGVYRAFALGPQGASAESTDTDPDKALTDCRTFALLHRPQ